MMKTTGVEEHHGVMNGTLREAWDELVKATEGERYKYLQACFSMEEEQIKRSITFPKNG